jgi:LPLT family lysophospholipid transporter-like MFS transporter
MNSSRNYRLLLIGQFLGAFGDNAILAVIVGQLTYLSKAGLISDGRLRLESAVYTSLLFIPYVLLAPLAGYLNDRHGKVRWLVGGNAIKVAGTLVCAAGLALGHWCQGLGYLIVGIGACFYGPAKYGVLPEILPADRLVKANGTVELLTLVSILGGAIAGSLLSDVFADQVILSFCVIAVIYAGATVANLLMSPSRGDPNIRLSASVSAFNSHLAEMFSTGRLGRLLLGTALFWVCGATMKINFQPWGLEVLHLDSNTQVALLGLWLSVGVMIGSVLAGLFHKVGELGCSRYYGLAMAGLLAVLYWVAPSPLWLHPSVSISSITIYFPVTILLVLIGVAAGLFLIPLNAALQAESDPSKLGKTIAAQNLGDNLGMCLAGGYALLSVRYGLSASGVFLGLGLGLALACLAVNLSRGAGHAVKG